MAASVAARRRRSPVLSPVPPLRRAKKTVAESIWSFLDTVLFHHRDIHIYGIDGDCRTCGIWSLGHYPICTTCVLLHVQAGQYSQQPLAKKVIPLLVNGAFPVCPGCGAEQLNNKEKVCQCGVIIRPFKISLRLVVVSFQESTHL